MTTPQSHENDFLGREERLLAAALSAQLPAGSPALVWSGVDLRPAAEHLLFTALRHPSGSEMGRGHGPIRPLLRVAREVAHRGRRRAGPLRDPVHLAVFITQPVHWTLFAPVAAELPRDLSTTVVDARTGVGSRSDSLGGAGDRLTEHLDLGAAALLGSHALSATRHLSRPPRGWTGLVGRDEAMRLTAVLRRGLPLAALDAARVASFVEHRRPKVVACFSESGLLARIVPAVAAARGAPKAVLDLPHAEAADPWGTVGAGYDGVAVYGPRAARVMVLAGIPDDRVTQVGPLRYDAVLAREPVAPLDSPRRIVLASQPGDPTKPAVHPDVKRAVLRAAIGAAAALAPAELRIVPHPTETDRITDDLLAQTDIPEGVEVRRDAPGTLHDLLPGALVLMTGASQSVFDAVLSGVPAITMAAAGGLRPAPFAAEGIALGAESTEGAIDLAVGLADPSRRSAVLHSARTAIGDRLGPLDGRAAARTAEWLMSFLRR